MSRSGALRQVVRIVSDGTGRSPEEVRVLAAATAAVIIVVGAVRGLMWVVDYATNLDVSVVPARRPSG